MSKKLDVYQIVTDRIMAQLEKGVVPWHRPWSCPAGDEPKNFVTGKPYRGVNVFFLLASGFSSPYFLTFKQAQDRGFNVRKGEKGIPVVFWTFLDVEDKETGKKRKVPFLRYYTVFNSSQVEGLEITSTAPQVEHDPLQSAQALVDLALGRGLDLRHSSQGRAFYSPGPDFVSVPKDSFFPNQAEYYSTLFHEITHWTGHASRLDRDLKNGFGSDPYAKEELVAEMGASFFCAQAGILHRTVDNSAAYIGSWLKRLKDDRKLVVCAAAQAQKAVDFVLGRFEENGQ